MTAKRIIIVALLLLPVSALAGVERIDISPAGLVSLNQGHSGQFMGSAVTADFYFNRSVAFRTTVGLTRDRYFPADLSYSESDYGLWLSLSPYFQLNVTESISPYLALIGTFTSGSGINHAVAPPVGFEQAPFARLQQDARDQNFYSLGATVGSKFRLLGSVSLFGEVSHFFYTSFKDNEVTFGADQFFPGREFEFERNPTYLSLGLSYSLHLGKDKK